jgi:hypothetical protein
VAELETGGHREYTYEIDGGLSYTLVDEKFSVGAETKVEFISDHGDRSNYETSILVGPSVQWRPVPRLSVNLAPLFGITGCTPVPAPYWVALISLARLRPAAGPRGRCL